MGVHDSLGFSALNIVVSMELARKAALLLLYPLLGPVLTIASLYSYLPSECSQIENHLLRHKPYNLIFNKLENFIVSFSISDKAVLEL